MKKKETVTFKISYEMYLFYNRLYKLMNEKRTKEGKEEISKSRFYDIIIRKLIDYITEDEGRLNPELAEKKIMNLMNYKIQKKQCKIISVRLSAYSIYALDDIFKDANGLSRGENIKLLLSFYCEKNRAK